MFESNSCFPILFHRHPSNFSSIYCNYWYDLSSIIKECILLSTSIQLSITIILYSFTLYLHLFSLIFATYFNLNTHKLFKCQEKTSKYQFMFYEDLRNKFLNFLNKVFLTKKVINVHIRLAFYQSVYICHPINSCSYMEIEHIRFRPFLYPH